MRRRRSGPFLVCPSSAYEPLAAGRPALLLVQQRVPWRSLLRQLSWREKKGAAAPCILAALPSAFKVIDELEANLSRAHHVLVVAPHCEET